MSNWDARAAEEGGAESRCPLTLAQRARDDSGRIQSGEASDKTARSATAVVDEPGFHRARERNAHGTERVR